MTQYVKTPVAAQQLGTCYNNLMYLLRSQKIACPPKDSSGDYTWSAQHMEAARNALSEMRQRRCQSA
jgi:hypothetical protein